MGAKESKVDSNLFDEPALKCSAHKGDINCLALSADQTLLASGSDDRTIKLWAKSTDESEGLVCQGILEGHEQYVTRLLFYEDALISGSADFTVRKWDPKSGQCVKVMEGHKGMVTALACHKKMILSASNDKTVICWDFETGQMTGQLKGHTQNVNAVTTFSTTDSGGGGRWRTGRAIEESASVTQYGIRECIYTGSSDRTAKSWSMRSYKRLLTFHGHVGPVTQVMVESTGRILYTASLDGTLRSWYAETAKPQYVFEGHGGEISCFEMFDKLLFTGSSDGTARSWLAETGVCVRIYRGHKRCVRTIRKIDSTIVTVSEDGRIHCFEEKTGSLKYLYGKKVTACCNALEITEDYLITTANDGHLYLWPKWDKIDSERMLTENGPEDRRVADGNPVYEE
ncbi:unnamed protein product [Calicophoron daubneyi]|uniref:WD repeat-containing protein 86 n=1 Tax=Calicophoron daubneyi TaxID=300641 RepID=A0AAV2TNT8_CALDB